MGVLSLIANCGAVQAVGGTQTADTFAEWLASTASGAGPTRYWAMDDTSGTTMAADVGGIAGTYENTSNLTLNITDAQSEKWVGFGGAAANPGRATITTPLQSAAFTAMLVCQLDRALPKHVLLTTGGGTVNGQFSFELVEDGAGGMKPRVWSVSTAPVVFVGSGPGTVPVGTSFVVFYVRRSGGTQECWVVTSTTVTQVPLTLESGTVPGSWSSHPAGTWYLGSWSNGLGPLNGVARSLALWNTALSTADISALGSIDPKVQDVVSASAIDAGTVEASASRDDVSLRNSVHPEVGFTASIVNPGVLGTWDVNESAFDTLTYDAGSTTGTDEAGTYKITKGGIDSSTVGLTISVESAPEQADLPFFGQYYGGVPFGASSAANIQLRIATERAVNFFFVAERTGVVDRVMMHWRNYTSGYAAGNGGTYTLEIKPANANTKLPIVGSSPICQVTGIQPGVTSSNSWSNLTHTFTTSGQVTALQPYSFVMRNTGANPTSNYVSCNVGLATSFNDPTSPADYEEPAGIDPASVGGSIAAVSGWSPVVISGIRLHQWPCLAEENVFHYRRLGGLYAMLRYSDGQWVGVGGGAWGGGATYKLSISGTTQLRDRFRVTRETRVVSGVFLRVVRLNASGGSLLFTLESGPASDTSANGTQIEQVTIPASSIFNVGASENVNNESGSAPIDFVPWTWVPFTQNRTLTLGSIYNARLSASGGGTFSMWCNGRSDSFVGAGFPFGPDFTWAEWETQRRIEWTAWEDSRGLMVSSNSGSTWSFGTPRLSMILFKCVV